VVQCRQAELIERIKELKRKRNAVILAHYYSRPEVQDIADFVGDSLGLSQEAVRQTADVIVFCGVHFMGESAAILCPDKTVLLPEIDATCPMADMVDIEGLRREKERHPDAPRLSAMLTLRLLSRLSLISVVRPPML